MRQLCRAMILAVLLGACCPTGDVAAENWPQWRGPTSNGISTEKGLPTEFGPEKNLAWKLPLPGKGGATPCVWGENIFLTAVGADGELMLICIGTNGKERWRRTLGKSAKTVRGDEGNMASPSPSTDGKHVWAMFGTGDIGCYDNDGKEVWKYNLQDRFGKFKIAFGMASTPVLHQNRLYLQLIHGDGNASTQEAIVVSLNADTGEEVWKKDRVTGSSRENEHSYASPTLYDHDGTQYLITHGADYAIAYDLNGTERWRVEGLNPQNDPAKRYHPTLRFVASPVANEGIVVVPTAKNGPIVTIKGSAKGAVGKDSDTHLWTRPQNTPDVPSPLIKDGLLYICRENGNCMCLDAKTGKEFYEERTYRNRYRVSPVYVDGKIYIGARDGKVTVIAEGREFKILAQNDLGEELSASPAISNGTMYYRTFDALWAIRAE